MARIIDEVTVTVKAGNGGKGCESNIRLSNYKFLPTGGEGGRGGSVIMRADSNVSTLRQFIFNKRFFAEAGEPGGSSRKKGRKGNDLTISVPPGTAVFRKDKRLLVRDLVGAGDEVLLAEGGKGGMGNEGGKDAQPGETKDPIELILTWKIPAEVFIVGLPNAGKSKLLNRLARTHAKEESYPFTTKNPELGVYPTSDFLQVHLCELPALYKESVHGRGVGIDFLKHLSRAKLLFLILDPLNAFATTLAEGHQILLEVLEAYDKSFLEIPRVVIVNKMDLPEVRKKIEEENFHPVEPIFLISAQTGEGIEALMRYAVQKVKEVHV